MDTPFLLTTVTTIGLALAGYLITYFITLRTNQRGEQLTRVSRQLKELYGPMFALTSASRLAMLTSIRDDLSAVEAGTGDDDSEQTKRWVLWMQTVIMPINEALYDIITQNSDLFIEAEMPECILTFLAHTASYKVVRERWKNGDYSVLRAAVEYPRDLGQYSQRSYEKLKQEQLRLIGAKIF